MLDAGGDPDEGKSHRGQAAPGDSGKVGRDPQQVAPVNRGCAFVVFVNETSVHVVTFLSFFLFASEPTYQHRRRPRLKETTRVFSFNYKRGASSPTAPTLSGRLG